MLRLRPLLAQISVEPVLLLYSLGSTLYSPVYSQLIEQHVCRQVDHYSEAICANLSAHPHEAALVRGHWAVWNWYVEALNMPLVIVFLLFVAPWSDRYGRKWMMLSAPLFAVLVSLQLLANVVWYDKASQYFNARGDRKSVRKMSN